MLRFGWPLLVTGFLMFGVLQGNQFLVATSYSMADLGPYAGAAALTMAPTFFFGRVFNSIALPIMAGVQNDPSSFERRYSLIIALICVFSAAYSVGMIVGAEAIMQLAYGAKYAGSGYLLVWLVAANSFRNIRIAPAIAAMARGDSMNQMTSNIARVLALVPASAVALSGQPLWTVACTGLFGEALACAVSFNRLSKRHRVPLALNVWPTAIVATTVVSAGLVSQLAPGLPRWYLSVSPRLAPPPPAPPFCSCFPMRDVKPCVSGVRFERSSGERRCSGEPSNRRASGWMLTVKPQSPASDTGRLQRLLLCRYQRERSTGPWSYRPMPRSFRPLSTPACDTSRRPRR